MSITGLQRNAKDQFYTHDKIAIECWNIFINKISPDLQEDYFIEPSAGNGSFSKILDKSCSNVLSYDIEPKHSSIKEMDFLTLDYIPINKTHVIGNPPFGRQSSLAKQFIKKSCEFATSIGFILPKSFKKESCKKAFPSIFHLIFEMDLPKKSFYLSDNISHDVPCVFQIWVKMDNPRIIPITEIPTYYKFVSKLENPSFAIRRVGGTAGILSIDSNDKNPQSHYFIKLGDHIDLYKFINLYKQIVFDTDNTVGPKSISKQEFIYALNQLI